MRRAPKGGTIAINGEHYKGGAFLPATRLPKQGKAPKRGGFCRELVAPGEFADLAPGERSVFRVFCALSRDLVPFPEEHPCWNFHDRALVVKAIDLYKSGTRIYREGDL